MRRKTPTMLRLEQEQGKPIQEIVTEALNRQGSIGRAAESLGLKTMTFYYFMIRLGIEVETKKRAYVAEESENKVAVA